MNSKILIIISLVVVFLITLALLYLFVYKGSSLRPNSIINNNILAFKSNDKYSISGHFQNNSVLVGPTIKRMPINLSSNKKYFKDDFQRWTKTENEQLKRKGVNLCLDIQGGNPVSGAKIIQNPCSDAGSQKWSISNAGQIQSKSNKDLCISVNAIDEGQEIFLKECKNTPNQILTLL